MLRSTFECTQSAIQEAFTSLLPGECSSWGDLRRAVREVDVRLPCRAIELGMREGWAQHPDGVSRATSHESTGTPLQYRRVYTRTRSLIGIQRIDQTSRSGTVAAAPGCSRCARSRPRCGGPSPTAAGGTNQSVWIPNRVVDVRE